MCDITMLFMILVVMVFYYNYNNRVNDKLNNIRIPVAKFDIEEGSIINADMIYHIDVSIDEIGDNTYTYMGNVIGKISTKEILQGEQFTFDNLK